MVFCARAVIVQPLLMSAPLDLTRAPAHDPLEIYRFRDGLYAVDLIAAAITDRFGRERDMRVDSLRDFASLLQQFQGRTIKLVVLRGDDDLVGTIDVRSLEAAR